MSFKNHCLYLLLWNFYWNILHIFFASLYFYYWFVRVLYIFRYKSFSILCIGHVIFPVPRLLTIFLMSIFQEGTFNFNEIQFIIVLIFYSKKSLPATYLACIRHLIYYLEFSWCLIVFAFGIRSMISVELIFVFNVK